MIESRAGCGIYTDADDPADQNVSSQRRASRTTHTGFDYDRSLVISPFERCDKALFTGYLELARCRATHSMGHFDVKPAGMGTEMNIFACALGDCGTGGQKHKLLQLIVSKK
ncbi:hypothetical protein PH7735_03847 [Shimia thalassica]|uniref:Uncharacterized protein n=1 Tax=Shimia thalassica TaxID=1715693 RepID=A0A0P1IX68_9RHOB|nr:hypothetical protein PH7735_03847 [Shimia thalassica]